MFVATGNLSDCNNVICSTLVSQINFGSEEEVAILLCHHKRNDMKGVKPWYDHYRFASRGVINYIEHRQLKSYWPHTESCIFVFDKIVNQTLFETTGNAMTI